LLNRIAVAKQQLSVVILRAGAVTSNRYLQAGAAGVCLRSSTVLAAVTIVVEHRARLSLSVEIVGERHDRPSNYRRSGIVVIWLVDATFQHDQLFGLIGRAGQYSRCRSSTMQAISRG